MNDMTHEQDDVRKAWWWLREAADDDPAENKHNALWNARLMAGYVAAKDARIAELEAEVAKRREMMDEVEWVLHEDDQGDWYSCPWCGAMAVDPGKGKHVVSCPYAALTKEATDAE